MDITNTKSWYVFSAIKSKTSENTVSRNKWPKKVRLDTFSFRRCWYLVFTIYMKKEEEKNTEHIDHFHRPLLLYV